MKKYYFVGYRDKNKPDAIIELEDGKNGFDFMRKNGLTSMSRAYASEEELIEHEKIRTDCKCVMCGGLIKTNYNNYKEFEKHRMCFGCNHWLRIFLTRNQPQRLIIDGTSYWMDENEDGAGFKGFGGRAFKIQRINQKPEEENPPFISKNLWCQGEIPDIWRRVMPDNAKFVKEG